MFFPSAVAPSSVRWSWSTVRGDGRAADVQSAGRASVRSGGSADASSSDFAKTQVRYTPGQASKGLTVALYLGTANVVEAASASVQDGSRILHGDVLVVIGRDYPSLRGLLAQSASSTTAISTSSAPARSTSTTTTTSGTTPDTRYVPVAPKSLGPLVGCP